jgi:predicted DsbA family dithiol-disulfide isomerase
MLLEIFSDTVCPWCYIGKRRLERALEDFPHADQVRIVYRSFQLDPTADGTLTVRSRLARTYGLGDAQIDQMVERVYGLAAELGVTFDYEDAPHVATVDAHRLLHLALDQGLQGELKEALLAAYFTRGESMADHAVLRKVAVEVGLDQAAVDEVLAGDRYSDAVQADVAQARAYGATGVPFFVVDQKYAVSGAQPTELFGRLLQQAWTEREPALQVLGGDACGPDGCPI